MSNKEKYATYRISKAVGLDFYLFFYFFDLEFVGLHVGDVWNLYSRNGIACGCGTMLLSKSRLLVYYFHSNE